MRHYLERERGGREATGNGREGREAAMEGRVGGGLAAGVLGCGLARVDTSMAALLLGQQD